MYRPLPKELTINKSYIEGLGLFAEEDLPANKQLGVSHVKDARFEKCILNLTCNNNCSYS